MSTYVLNIWNIPLSFWKLSIFFVVLYINNIEIAGKFWKAASKFLRQTTMYWLISNFIYFNMRNFPHFTKNFPCKVRKFLVKWRNPKSSCLKTNQHGHITTDEVLQSDEDDTHTVKKLFTGVPVPKKHNNTNKNNYKKTTVEIYIRRK